MRPDVFSRSLGQRSSGQRPAEVRDPRDWARRMRAREQAGERLPLAQRQMWREALTHELTPEERAAPL